MRYTEVRMGKPAHSLLADIDKTLFGDDALEYRLGDAGVKVVVTDGQNLHKVNAIRDRLEALDTVFSVDRPGDGAVFDGRYKLIAEPGAGPPRLFDLVDDPDTNNETENAAKNMDHGWGVPIALRADDGREAQPPGGAGDGRPGGRGG